MITDHSTLRWLKDPNGRLDRWALGMQQWDFDVLHRKGALHHVPDVLEYVAKMNCRNLYSRQSIFQAMLLNRWRARNNSEDSEDEAPAEEGHEVADPEVNMEPTYEEYEIVDDWGAESPPVVVGGIAKYLGGLLWKLKIAVSLWQMLKMLDWPMMHSLVTNLLKLKIAASLRQLLKIR